jgi:hypothetical protein
MFEIEAAAMAKPLFTTARATDDIGKSQLRTSFFVSAPSLALIVQSEGVT